MMIHDDFTIPYGHENYSDKGKRKVKSKIVINSNKKAKLEQDDEISLPSESDMDTRVKDLCNSSSDDCLSEEDDDIMATIAKDLTGQNEDGPPISTKVADVF